MFCDILFDGNYKCQNPKRCSYDQKQTNKQANKQKTKQKQKQKNPE